MTLAQMGRSLHINLFTYYRCSSILSMATINTMEEQSKKLHIAVFPWLAFGHIIPFFELAKLIAQKGHKISFISTPRNIQRLSKIPPNLKPCIDLTEIHLPHVDKLPEDAEATMDVPEHTVPYLKKAFDGLEQPLAQFLHTSKPDWIIYDFAPYWLPPINAKLGISGIHFSIFSAFGVSFYLDTLLSQASNTSSEVALRPFEDMMMSVDHVKENESGVSDVFRVRSCLDGADVIASRGCWEIDGESLKNIETKLKKPVIPVGLLPPSIQYSDSDGGENEEWEKIVVWLNKLEKGSVVYIAFGSEATLSKEDFTELAHALELSGLSFLWALKKQNVPVSSDSFELLDRLKNLSNGRGVVRTGWLPQLRILAHKSIGGFLTHCGWSSVIESLQFACPLIMLPLKNEQGLVARQMEDKKVGIVVPRNEQDGKFTRESVAKALTTVILQREGKFYRKEAVEMSKIFGDKELHQKYIDELVDYMTVQRFELSSKD